MMKLRHITIPSSINMRWVLNSCKISSVIVLDRRSVGKSIHLAIHENKLHLKHRFVSPVRRKNIHAWFQMGFDGLFFGRADYQDIDNRTKTRNMETIWKASSNLGKNGIDFERISTMIENLNTMYFRWTKLAIHRCFTQWIWSARFILLWCFLCWSTYYGSFATFFSALLCISKC